MRKTNQLSAKKVAAITRPGHHGDRHGLYLQINNTGAKSWLLRYMINGRSREMGLGPIY